MLTLSRVPFSLLPSGFLLGGLLLYIVVESAGMVAASLTGVDEQVLVIGMRLLELVGFMGLIYRFEAVGHLGLHKPSAQAVRLFIAMAGVCTLGAVLLYVLMPTWFAYLQLPAWLHGMQGLLLMVVLAPMVEELVFRGLLYRMLRERWPVLASVAVSAIFFSLVHHGQIVSPQLLGGIIFALGYEWSKSLWVSIGLHMGANAAVYMLATI